MSIWPQITWIGLAASSLTLSFCRAGEAMGPYRPVAHIFWILVAALILYSGGFFASLGLAP